NFAIRSPQSFLRRGEPTAAATSKPPAKMPAGMSHQPFLLGAGGLNGEDGPEGPGMPGDGCDGCDGCDRGGSNAGEPDAPARGANGYRPGMTTRDVEGNGSSRSHSACAMKTKSCGPGDAAEPYCL